MKKLKKFKTILGSISLIVGFAFFLTAQMVISTTEKYTFTKPFTKYELQILSYKWIGIVLIISGILDIILVVLAKKKEAEMKDPSNLTISSVRCPNCGLTLSSSTKVCPKCKTNLKGDA